MPYLRELLLHFAVTKESLTELFSDGWNFLETVLVPHWL